MANDFARSVNRECHAVEQAVWNTRRWVVVPPIRVTTAHCASQDPAPLIPLQQGERGNRSSGGSRSP